MSKVTPTVAERAFHDEMRRRGCMVILPHPFTGTTICGAFPEIHHITALGMGKRQQWAVLPLCDDHHPKSGGISKKKFRDNYGDEWTLYFKILNEIFHPETGANLKAKHKAEIIEKIKAYANSGHASKQFIDEYERVGGEVWNTERSR